MSKLSVQKPFTVLVAVILILVLGFISFTNMTTDLLPAIELPYILVITTYPGASPEKVESTVTRPLEATLGTAGGVKNITSTSSENSSMVVLEFESGTNMDSAMIALSNSVDLVEGSFPDEVGSPILMQMSPDMLPVMIASVDIEGKNVEQVSEFVTETVQPAFERLDGVASVEPQGLVESRLTVTMNQSKIDLLNARVLASVNSELADAEKEIADGWAELAKSEKQLVTGRQEIADGQQKLNDAQSALSGQKGEMSAQLAKGSAEVDSATAQLNALLAEETTLNANKAAFETEKAAMQQLADMQSQVDMLVLAVANAAQQMADPSASPITDPAAAIAVITAMDDATFDAVWAVIANNPVAPLPDTLKSMTREGFLTLYAQVQAAPARITAIDTELTNIQTRLMAATAMKPQLQAALQQAKDGYAQLESGKMTAVNELTKGEVTMQSTQAQLDAAKTQMESGEEQLKTAREQLQDAQEQFEEARDQAYRQANLDGVITQDTIAQILMAQNFSMPAGYVDDEGRSLLVKVGDNFTSVGEVENALLFHIEAGDIGDVRLNDVADLEITNNAGESYAKINGNEGVLLTMQKQSVASTATVTHALNAAIAELAAENEGLRIVPLLDQGQYIDLVIHSVLQNLLFGGALAILILLLFLRDLKPTFIIACSIPISVLFALVLMYFSGITLNLISLSGLALGVGMLVDNSIVVIENIYRLRGEGVPAARAAMLGAKQMSGAIIASTLTTICVFLPIVFTEGITRQLFQDMGLTIGYSLIASLLAALTVVPAMGSTMLRATHEQKPGLLDKAINAYGKLLSLALRHKAVVLLLAVALLGYAMFETTRMGTAFIPSMDSPQISMSMNMPDEATEDETYAMADEVMTRTLAVEGVETVGAMSGGSGLMGGGGGGVSYYVLLAEERDVSNTEIARAITAATADLACEVSVSESNMDMSALGGSGIQIALRGTNLDVLGETARDLAVKLRDVKGLTEIDDGQGESSDELRFTVNKDAAMRHGLTVAQVYSEISKAVSTETSSTTLSVGTEDYPVVIVKDGGATRQSILDHVITVKKQNGETEDVRLDSIATANNAYSVAGIQRENQQRTMQVSAAVADGYNIGLVSRDVEKLLDGYALPAGCTAEIEGENETINSAMRDLVLMILLAVVFIYLIMVAQFQSLLSPFIVMFTLPLAFTGGLLLLRVSGMELSIIAMLGFLVLAGIVVNNGIVFVDTINQLRMDGMRKREAILRTGKTRMRPILMTALTTILAMSTMALGIGDGAEMTQPMAVVTIGGLVYATVLTLFVVPVLYDIFYRRAVKRVDVDEGAHA